MIAKPAGAQSTTPQPSYPVTIIAPTPSPTMVPSPTTALTPIPTPTPSFELSYAQVSMTSEGNDTVLVLNITAIYNFGNSVTLNYQDFTVQIFTVRGGLAPPSTMMNTGQAKPQENGSVTVGSNNKEVYFNLTFSFPTTQNNFDGPHKFSSYQLDYTGTITSTVPELSAIVILPLLLSVFFLAVVFRHRKKPLT